jgi:O-antigen ligase
MSSGGDHTFVLWELRAQVYFYLAYLMGTNLFEDREAMMKVLWAMTIGIALKSIIGTRNFIINPNVTADEGVLRHEDSLLMNMVVLGALLMGIGGMDARLRRTMLLFVPTCVTTVLANGRRASIAALLLAMPITMVMCATMMQEKRKKLMTIMGVLGFVMAIYTPIAWNGKGVWALPARAIRSQFDPSDRDASSDYYRLAENANLKYTRDLNPWIGYGYGKEYITIYEQYGRTDVFARILPHNGVLWIWMRLGHPGFFCFWMFFASVMVWGPNMLKKVKDPKLQIIGIYGIGAFLMLVMYGKYDLAFANYRAMILVGMLLGLCASVPRIDELQEKARLDEIEANTFRTPVATPEEISRHEEGAEEWRKRTQW